MSRTVFTTPFVSPLLRRISTAVLWFTGWKAEGEIPSIIKKCVVIAAPHTTNWDFPIMLMTAFALRINVSWMGKHTLFRFPFGWLMKWLGGIPVDRSGSHDTVSATIQMFRVSKGECRVAIAPEGTRKRGGGWKSGYYYIADGAGVPIVLATIDYLHRWCGLKDVFYPTGDADTDMKKIEEMYAGFIAEHNQ